MGYRSNCPREECDLYYINFGYSHKFRNNISLGYSHKRWYNHNLRDSNEL